MARTNENRQEIVQDIEAFATAAEYEGELRHLRNELWRVFGDVIVPILSRDGTIGLGWDGNEDNEDMDLHPDYDPLLPVEIIRDPLPWIRVLQQEVSRDDPMSRAADDIGALELLELLAKRIKLEQEG